IDPLLSQTAAKADLYLRVRPGSDGAVAQSALRLTLHCCFIGLTSLRSVNAVQQMLWWWGSHCLYVHGFRFFFTPLAGVLFAFPS
ncbi:hypothetical protein, partial [Salmonella enterica]|uniref:hypothetical protein n=1 Tax=Salmonella enterica TaxID=28901 RepID=UPI004035356E